MSRIFTRKVAEFIYCASLALQVKRRRMKVVKRPRIKPEPLPSYETAPSQNSYQAPHPGIATAYVAPAKVVTK